MNWIKNHSKIADWLYNQSTNSTFAVQFGDDFEMTKYATISKGPFPDTKNYYETGFAEPYDVVCRVNIRKDPSAEFSEEQSISYDPSEETVYVKKGVGRFERIDAICTDALKANYDSGRELIARCDECGTEFEVPVEENKMSMSNGLQKDEHGDIITPCCRTTNWSTDIKS